MFIPKFKKNDDNQVNIVLPVMPLRDIIIFPNMIVPLFVGRKSSINALQNAMQFTEKSIFMIAQNKAEIDNPKEKDLKRVGTIGRIIQLLKLPDGTVKALVEGIKRGQAVKYISNKNFLQAEIALYSDSEIDKNEAEAVSRAIIETFESYSKINNNIPPDLVKNISSIKDPELLANTVASHYPLKIKDKQLIIEATPLKTRLNLLLEKMKSEIEIIEMEKKIKGRVQKQMDKTQRQYYLNEQMRAIKKEMGDDSVDFQDELKDLEKRIKRKRVSKEAAGKIKQEFQKLKMMAPMSAEAAVVRNYIEWLIDIPWYKKSKVKINIDEAEKILDEDHYGLEKPKERIIEYLAVQSLVKKIRGPILCFVGPPGVGKTSLAKSVARSTGREFVRLSLGGVRDEAEIRGHRRTYIGAMPGKIIQSLKKVKVSNPVFCLDEVDKMSMDFRGDPSAALLEVLDPEQNDSFNDHYLDVDYDLSSILFITTANTLPDIPLPLQDRMEIIRIAGYTEFEKLNIATKFLIPKQSELNGLTKDQIMFPEDTILTVIREYTKEAGVRNLEREIASICRKVAREIVKNNDINKIEKKVTNDLLIDYLGPKKYRYGQLEKKDQIGLVNGLAWTQFGGELLVVETTIMPGKGQMMVTGKLGDVMKESATAALSYVRSRSKYLKLYKDFYKNYDIHIHVPEGAIPKDGPSAGITICSSIVSALTKRPVCHNIAMTGEITLRGRILPIGGLKEKLLAAHRAGIKNVVIPKENEKDLHDIPKTILDFFNLITVEDMDDLLSNNIKVVDGDKLFSEPVEDKLNNIDNEKDEDNLEKKDNETIKKNDEAISNNIEKNYDKLEN